MSWAIHDALKWLIVFTVSFIVIIALYMIMIQKVDLLRFLFGMKTTQRVFDISRKGFVMVILTVLYVSLIVFAAAGAGRGLSPMPMTYDPELDVVLSSESITTISPSGVRAVDDDAASNGKAIEFYEGASERTEARPKVYVEMRFRRQKGNTWSG
jgi:hypothetical protein